MTTPQQGAAAGIRVGPVPRVPAGASGPALFSYGFRPFFLFGGAWAALSVAMWLPQYFGQLTLPIAIPPLDWHVHELLYGYLAAVVAGFLLTSIPNWTGRFPLAGRPLMALVALWVAGRAAMLCSATIGETAAAVIDMTFLPAIAAVCLREIVAGRNWRNLRVIVILAVLAIGNGIFHLEVIIDGTSDYGRRVGIAAAIALIILVGGRIVPSFTRNWLARANPGRLPQPFSPFDGIAIGAAVAALGLWVPWPEGDVTGIGLAVAGLLQAVRLARWAGDRTFRDPLVLILHVGYGFVPLGFLALAATIAWPLALPPSAGIHLWTAGAIATMTLAVMTRATLGHTGRALRATAGTCVIYALALLAVLCRIAASLTAAPEPLLYLAAAAWVAAFGGFALVYGPMVLRPRLP